MQRAGEFTALTWDGVAPDAALGALPPRCGLRLHIAAGQQQPCCGAAVDLVAVEPGECALPFAVRSAVRHLAPGHAIAASGLDELADGWIAMPGVDIRIAGHADLGDSVIAITLADAAALLQAKGGRQLHVRTVVVLDGTPAPVPAGWHVVAEQVASVPLAPEPVAAHLAGCAA
ncbi:hypothetical protein ABZ357_38375 [Streptomyces sp. NPDC005917]|uniref:hypothetical protein n=1 Tax=unclassified Streptomyces TaxID=2593676 RepID=UPI0033D55695